MALEMTTKNNAGLKPGILHFQILYSKGVFYAQRTKSRRRSRSHDHPGGISPVSRRDRFAEYAGQKTGSHRRTVGSRSATPSEIYGRSQYRRPADRPAAD